MRLVCVAPLIAWCALSSCRCRVDSPSNAADASVADSTLVIRAMSEPNTLNNLDGKARDAWTSRITRNLVFESLLEIDPKTYELVPQLAERMVESSDHTSTTFTLRRGVAFHDGSTLTARDVIAVFDAIADSKLPTESVRTDLSGLASWQATDEHTVVLTWTAPSPFALRELAKIPIYSRASVAAWASLSERPVGTGPYIIGAWERGNSLTLNKSPQWRGRPVALDRITFRFVKDANIAAERFQRDEFDVMTNVQPALWKSLEADPNSELMKRYQPIKGIDNSYSYIAWNEARADLKDLRVRRALAALYPVEQVATSVDLGLEVATTCPFYFAGTSCDRSVAPIAHDLGAAREQLRGAGFSDSNADGIVERQGKPLALTFLIPASSARLAKVAPLFQEECRKVGIALNIEKVDSAVFVERLAKRDFDIVSRVWTEFDAVQEVFRMFHSSQIDGGSNFISFSNTEVDSLLEAIRSEWDGEKRRALERKLHAALYAEQPYLFMTARTSLDMAKKKVHGLVPSPLWYDLRAVWVEH